MEESRKSIADIILSLIQDGEEFLRSFKDAEACGSSHLKIGIKKIHELIE